MRKVFSNHIRLEILNLLRDKEMSVTELIEKTKLSQANISQHLSIMKSKGIVVYNRKGKKIYYKIANPKIIKAFDIIREVMADKNKAMKVKKVEGTWNFREGKSQFASTLENASGSTITEVDAPID